MKSIAVLLFIATATTCFAQSPSNSSQLTFLRAGADYVIQFPDHLKAFSKQLSSVEFGTTSDGKRIPVTTKINHVVTVFTVKQLGPAQWALLEIPSSLTDAAKWNLKRTSAAKLTPETIQKLESTDTGRNRLEELRRRAALSVDTTQSWVNLSHAFSISEVPTEDKRPEFSVNVEFTKPNSDKP